MFIAKGICNSRQFRRCGSRNWSGSIIQKHDNDGWCPKDSFLHSWGKPRSIKWWQTARVGEALDSGSTRSKNIFTGERNSSRGVQCSPLSPFPLLHCHQKPALPAATGRDRVMVTWIGVPLSTPLTTGAFFYSPLQLSRTLPLV